MTNWFTVERLSVDTFAIGEYGHWEETHSYLLCGTKAALLIDTGLGVADIRQVVENLTALPIQAVLTHAHWDHIGGCRLFDSVAVHEAEADWLSGRFPLPTEVVKRNLTREPCAFPEGFSPEGYEVYSGGADRLLRDGDLLELGNRTLRVLHTPGHSPGHCCFFEEERGDLYTGDLLYRGCLDAFYPTTDPELFLRSVKRVGELSVNRILPGHHRLPVPLDMPGRVENALDALKNSGRLRQGEGVFDFGDFQIHI